MSQYDIPSGLYISDVRRAPTPTPRAYRTGDILMEVNHTPVTTTAEVSDIKNAFDVGDSMTFTIWRDGETFEVEVLLMDTNDLYR